MNTHPTTQPLISLVVLVRDEAVDLRRLLSWHRDLYDEAVVVDTGSNDDSLAVARELGAQVSHFPWCDDFSAARNYGLSQAQGQWALILDCDELIATDDFPALRQLCAAEPAGWVFEQWNYCNHIYDPQWFALPDDSVFAPADATGYMKATTCRLFPVRKGLRYEGVVHELPDPAIVAAGLAIHRAPIAIHHYGHMVDKEKQNTKRRRYANLLRKKLQLDPQDVKARYEMAVQLSIEGNADLAERLLSRTICESPHHPETHRARLLLGRLLIANDRPAAAVSHMEMAVHKWPALREGWIDTARLHQRMGHLDRAAQFAEGGRKLFPADQALQQVARQVTEALADKCRPVD